VEAILVDAQADGAALVLRFEPLRGDRTPIEDRIRLDPPGEMPMVQGVGRLLRLLRAARVKGPENPYALAEDPDAAVALVRRCEGTRVTLHVTQRIERTLSVWTESGVERIGGVVDFGEDVDGLWVRRRGGQSILRVPRRTIIRFSCSSQRRPEIVSVEGPTRRELH
jgi:hypothetical protein